MKYSSWTFAFLLPYNQNSSSRPGRSAASISVRPHARGTVVLGPHGEPAPVALARLMPGSTVRGRHRRRFGLRALRAQKSPGTDPVVSARRGCAAPRLRPRSRRRRSGAREVDTACGASAFFPRRRGAPCPRPQARPRSRTTQTSGRGIDPLPEVPQIADGIPAFNGHGALNLSTSAAWA